MIKKIDKSYISFISIGAIIVLFFISFIIIQKAYADIANIDQLSIVSDVNSEITSSNLGLKPDVSYYHYYLTLAIENRH